MAGEMHVAVVEHFGKPLVQQEWDIPTPGPGQILVKTEACGVCHTDLHAATGDWPLKPKLPFIPGHGRLAVSPRSERVSRLSRRVTASACPGSTRPVVIANIA
jgi:D-arabinose 1-dehydrogenase-like Zn-dependent alcohol dehydrogenase